METGLVYLTYVQSNHSQLGFPGLMGSPRNPEKAAGQGGSVNNRDLARHSEYMGVRTSRMTSRRHGTGGSHQWGNSIPVSQLVSPETVL